MIGVDWQPHEDIETPRTSTADMGIRNGRGEFVPYHWNPGERARQMRLEALRCWMGWKLLQRITDNPGTIPVRPWE